MRQVNSKLLKQWIEQQGEDGKLLLAQKSKVSVVWIEKAVGGRYKSDPSRLLRSAVCQATGLKMDDLFPEVRKREQAS